MNYQIIYTPVALAEYKDAIIWYDERSKTAAENFVKAVTEKIKTICQDHLR